MNLFSRLEVTVTGRPKPEGKWLKHGEEIVPSNEFIIENLDDGTSVLTITEVFPDDTGEIVYEAQNPLGVAVTTTQLLVETTEGTSTSKLTGYIIKIKCFQNVSASDDSIPQCLFRPDPIIIKHFRSNLNFIHFLITHV